MPFFETRQVCTAGLAEYINFQFTLPSRTLFSGVEEFLPAHYAFIRNGKLGPLHKYWNLEYQIDYTHTEKWFLDQLRDILSESVSLHCRSDVPIASYVSGGIDSSLISALSADLRHTDSPQAFVGRYDSHEGFDETFCSSAGQQGIDCNIVTITLKILSSLSDLVGIWISLLLVLAL